MSETSNDLFDGLQIMSPEELNAAVKGNDSEEPQDRGKEEEEGLELFKPVASESGDSDNTEKTVTTPNTRSSDSK